MAEIREADLPGDLDAVERLWLEYLTWGNDELDSRHGFRLPIRELLEHDIAPIAKFQPPDGLLLLVSKATQPSARHACGGLAPTPLRSSVCMSNPLIAAQG